MLEVLAARNYFETHGSFMEIRHDLGQRVADMSEEDLYTSIGFKPYGGLSAKQVFMVRKLYLQGNVEEALKKSGCKSEEELLKFLGKSFNEVFRIDSEEAQLIQYAEMITAHVFSTIMGIYNADPQFYGISSLLEECREKAFNRKDPLKISKADQKTLGDLYALYAPKLKVVKGIEPKVVGGTLYIPQKLSAKAEEHLKGFCVSNLLLNTVEVPAQMFVNYRAIGLGYNFTDLLDSNDENLRNIYTYMFDLALTKDVTLEDIITSMGFNIIHYWKQYKDTKCMFTLVDNDSVAVKFETGTQVMDLKIFFQRYQTNSLLQYENRR